MIGHNDKNNVSNLRYMYSQPSPVVDMLVDCVEYQISACQLTPHEQPRPGISSLNILIMSVKYTLNN